MDDVIDAVIGVDVGGTNTDAVILRSRAVEPRVLSYAKAFTTPDVTTGIKIAISRAINQREKGRKLSIQRVNIGTTHFVNAVVQRKDLTKVVVIRLCGKASRALLPYADFPSDLAVCINAGTYFVNGGYQVDGREISQIDKSEILDIVSSAVRKGMKNFVICGIFSPIRNDQELHVKAIIQEQYPEASITLSHQIGQSGLIERENAAILNECLKPLCKKTLYGFKAALDEMKIDCPLFFTSNDGTVVSQGLALEQPVCTFASGPTNSMRGAAFLSNVNDAIVVDIGGTTTDVGMLINGFPREASTAVKIGGVRTNFRMPDVDSIGLGGGSYIHQDKANGDLDVQVGPRSAGYKIKNEGFIFQSSKDSCNDELLTATDLAVAAGHVKIGNIENISDLPKDLVNKGICKIKAMVETAIDRVKLSTKPLPVIVVGGGGILLDMERGLDGAEKICFPDYFDVANAVGAALSQVSGSVEHIVSLAEKINNSEIDKFILEEIAKMPDKSPDEIRKEIRKSHIEKAVREETELAIKAATENAIREGADKNSIQLFEKSETPLAYLPGDATRITAKVIGNLDSSSVKGSMIDHDFHIPTEKSADYLDDFNPIEVEQSESRCIDVTPKEPFINEKNEWILSIYDVECIAIGAGILGCGGGGSPHLGKVLTKRALAEGKEIRVVNPLKFFADKSNNDLVFQPAYMGAPFVLHEKLVGPEMKSAIQCMADLYDIGLYKDGDLRNKENVEIKNESGVTYINDYKVSKEDIKKDQVSGKRNIVALMSAEIGGLNAMEPLLAGAELGLPVLDCDGMGRAFPELQMFGPLIYDSKPYPATLSDDTGRSAVALYAETAKDLENFFRRVVVEMGLSGAVLLPALTKDEVLNKTVMFSLSRAWRIGNSVLLARLNKIDPVQLLLTQERGKLLMAGKIIDVRRETTGGFNKGFVHVAGLGDSFHGQLVIVEFQNENLLARGVHPETLQTINVLSCTPDLISIVDSDTAEPVTTEMVRYGMRVSVVVLPIPNLMKTPKALKVVGPHAFGYSDIEYRSIGDSDEFTSIIS